MDAIGMEALSVVIGHAVLVTCGFVALVAYGCGYIHARLTA